MKQFWILDFGFSIGRFDNKNVCVLALCPIIFALCVPANSQEPARISKIGWFRARSVSSSPAAASDVIRRMLRELGYIENKNIAFEYRYTDGKIDRLPMFADELVRLKVDLLLTSSTPEVLAAKNATTTIPIVFYLGVDPVAAGLVHSLRQPGGNVTGITLISPVLATKRLELLKEILPKVSRVGMLWDQESGSAQEWQQSQATARELGVQLISMEIATADQIAGAFLYAVRSGAGALSVTRSSLINRNQKRITKLAAKHGLPAIYARADFVDSGGLIAYGATQPDAYKRVTVIIDKILKGAKPADLPVEQPTKFELVINLKTAKQIGLMIPPNVLARADRVIR